MCNEEQKLTAPLPQGPTGKNTRFHPELQRNLVIVPKILAHLQSKSAIYISALNMSRNSLVCSVASRKNFAALTTVPKLERNGSADFQRN